MARPERHDAPASRLCRGDDFAEGHRRGAGRRQRQPDGSDRRSRREICLRRDPRQPRAEPDPAACGARRPQGGLRRAGRDRAGDGQSEPHHRHHRLPRPRLLRAGQCAFDLVAQNISTPLRLAGAPARHRRAEAEDLRLHQCLRPPPCRPYRHSRRREEGRRTLPGHARRLRRREHLDRRDHRPRLRPRRDHRRDRDGSSRPISACGSTATRNSSTPTAASAQRRSRRRSMVAKPRQLDAGAERVRQRPTTSTRATAHCRRRTIIGQSLARRISPAAIAAVSSFGADSAVLLAHDRRDRPLAADPLPRHRQAFRRDAGLSRCAGRRFRPDRRPRRSRPMQAALDRDRPGRQPAQDATPTPAATSARSSRWRAAWSRSAPGSPAASASRRRRAARCRCSRRSARASASIRWRAGRRPTSPTTCARMLCARTRWSPMAICRSAASPARSRCKPGEDARSGRWAGQAKTECGIHLSGLELSLASASL